MYDHHLNDMIKILVDKKLIKLADKGRVKTAFDQYWNDKIAITWCAEDVIQYAKMHKKVVIEEEAIDILQAMLHHHDCEIGITWETINANLP